MTNAEVSNRIVDTFLSKGAAAPLIAQLLEAAMEHLDEEKAIELIEILQGKLKEFVDDALVAVAEH